MADGFVSRFDGVAYPASSERQLDLPLSMTGGGLLSRPGVRPGPGAEVTVGGSPESYIIAPHAGVITDTANGGSFEYVIPAAVTVTVPTRPGIGTSRIDEIVLVLRPTQKDVQVQVVSGMASASPPAPALTTGMLRLRRAVVPSAAGISLSLPAQRTVASGGILPVATTTERDAISPVPNGLVVHREDNSTHEARQAAEWRRLSTQLSKTTPSGVFTPAGAVVLDDACAVLIHEGLVTVHIKLSTVTYGAGTSINVTLGTIAAGLRPRMYFAPVSGWPNGVSGLVESATGSLSLRRSDAAASNGVVVLSGTWPI